MLQLKKFSDINKVSKSVIAWSFPKVGVDVCAVAVTVEVFETEEITAVVMLCVLEKEVITNDTLFEHCVGISICTEIKGFSVPCMGTAQDGRLD